MAADAQRRMVVASCQRMRVLYDTLIFGERDAGADADAYVGSICGLISRNGPRSTSKMGTT